MAKRKESARTKQFPDESSSDESDIDMLDVEFEWFDPQPEHDFHGLKTLLRQLFDVDSQIFDLSALTDLILAQPLLGSTVKVDGNQSDPYAFLTILNLHQHRDEPAVSALMDYIKKQTKTNASLKVIEDLLNAPAKAQIGLILTERLVNIPSEVVPPMYKMLVEEIGWALEEKEPYSFTHYLILSKTYQEIASTLDQEDGRPQKKKKKNKSMVDELEKQFYFHPEDEVLERHSSAHGGFRYIKEDAAGQSDAKRTFQELGIKPQGHMILIESAELEATVKALEEYLQTN